MFIGRYDCVHAGAAYKNPNTRLHIYLYPRNQDHITWKKADTVYFVDQQHDPIHLEENALSHEGTTKHKTETSAHYAKAIGKERVLRKQKRCQQLQHARQIQQLKKSRGTNVELIN